MHKQLISVIRSSLFHSYGGSEKSRFGGSEKSCFGGSEKSCLYGALATDSASLAITGEDAVCITRVST